MAPHDGLSTRRTSRTVLSADPDAAMVIPIHVRDCDVTGAVSRMRAGSPRPSSSWDRLYRVIPEGMPTTPGVLEERLLDAAPAFLRRADSSAVLPEALETYTDPARGLAG